MFDFLKKKLTTPPKNEANDKEEKNKSTSTGFFGRLKQGLEKTRAAFTSNLASLFLGKKELSPALLDEIEMHLLTADVGIEATDELLQTIKKKLTHKELKDSQAVFECLQEQMKQILRPCSLPFTFPENCKPYIILMVGINGSGKTTTIGKLAHYFKEQHTKTVMLAAGDTFRAAAIEQLQVWGERNHIPVIAQQSGADSAAVIFDAANAAKARGIDILLADTAGRLHTQSHLMGELKKVKRVLGKIDSSTPHETWIVLDASLGQNALNQVKQFNQEIGVTGIILTKLDGTAKGGIIFALAQQTKLPIRFIGLGEGLSDLRPFQADDFVEALFN